MDCLPNKQWMTRSLFVEWFYLADDVLGPYQSVKESKGCAEEEHTNAKYDQASGQADEVECVSETRSW